MTIDFTKAVAFAAIALAAAGCGRNQEAEEAPAAAEDPVAARLNDPVYLQKLEEVAAGKKEAMRAVLNAKDALTEAEESGTATAEELAVLSNAVKSAYDKLHENRQHAQAVVAAELKKGTDAAMDAFNESQKKGE